MQQNTPSQKQKLLKDQPTIIQSMIETAGKLAIQSGLGDHSLYAAIKTIFKTINGEIKIKMDASSPNADAAGMILKNSITKHSELLELEMKAYMDCDGSVKVLAAALRDRTADRNILRSTEIVSD